MTGLIPRRILRIYPAMVLISFPHAPSGECRARLDVGYFDKKCAYTWSTGCWFGRRIEASYSTTTGTGGTWQQATVQQQPPQPFWNSTLYVRLYFKATPFLRAERWMKSLLCWCLKCTHVNFGLIWLPPPSLLIPNLNGISLKSSPGSLIITTTRLIQALSQTLNLTSQAVRHKSHETLITLSRNNYTIIIEHKVEIRKVKYMLQHRKWMRGCPLSTST